MKKMYVFMGAVSFFAIVFFVKMYVFPTAYDPWFKGRPIAHRGLFNNNAGIPENSLGAFQAAVEGGYAIELDVQLTKDRRVVVYHDFTLKRMNGIKKPLSEVTLKELQSYPLLKTGEMVPTLQAVLDLVRGAVPLYIEVKRRSYQPADDLEEKVLEFLENYKGKVAILSFNPQSLQWFARHAPNLYRGQNFEPLVWERKPQGWKNRGLSHAFQAFFTETLVARPHFIVYNYNVTPEILAQAVSMVRPMISYNVHSKSNARVARKYASNVIFEDNLS